VVVGFCEISNDGYDLSPFSLFRNLIKTFWSNWEVTPAFEAIKGGAIGTTGLALCFRFLSGPRIAVFLPKLLWGQKMVLRF